MTRGHTVLPGSSLVPQDPSVLLTIAGMLQFKPVFLGREQPPRAPGGGGGGSVLSRVCTSQKCVRTGDVENVGVTTRHHTFFEMMGSFSFGDYFKREACQWAWEMATEEFKLPVDRIWVSVYEEDDETFNIWKDQVGVAGCRVQRLGASDNFWSSGPQGPCGPCSELYYDTRPERGDEGADLGDDTRFIEFYNLVFMQSNRLEDGTLEDLRKKNIDTGLGLERLAQILQKVPNNYETDLIFPIIEVAARLAGVKYHETDEKTKTKLKVIGDHARAVVYLISDGVSPSNMGRGYIVRRLIRRAVRMGRLLGIQSGTESTDGTDDGTFLPIVARQVVAMSGAVDPAVKGNAGRIYEELRREEVKFVQTLERGEKLLEELLDAAGKEGEGGERVLAGKDAFTLYDTYGFPVEITEEVAMERGVGVDMEGFQEEMEVQRKRAQAAHNAVKMTVGGAIEDLSSELSQTDFLGYTSLFSESTISAIIRGGDIVSSVETGEEVEVVLDRTPFYAESGGQVGDCGVLEVSPGGARLAVSATRRAPGGTLWLHRARLEEGQLALGDKVTATVDPELRGRATAHHTATHLLQAALKQVLGSDTSQAGSLVAFDRLRFDFNCPRSVTDEEIVRIEDLVNTWIGQAVPLESTVMALDEAKAAGAVAMFGEKYGEEVRVVNVPQISMELCGGTHVKNTSEIRGFKVISEAGIASGVRRIEAVAGPAVIDYLNSRDGILKSLSSNLKVRADEVPTRVNLLQDELRLARGEAADLRGQLAVAKAELLAGGAVTVGTTDARVLVASLESVDAESLKTASERLLERMGDPGAVVLGSTFEGKVSIVAAFSPKVVKAGLQAGKFVGAVAKICGGGGGGRPNLAQAGGKMPEKLPEALDQARRDLEKALTS